MIEVYRSQDSPTIGHLQGILESEGIKTYLRNEYLSNTAIAVPEFTPALCILEESDVSRGVRLIRDYLESSNTIPSEEQVCPQCGETIPGTFAACWNCGTALKP